MLNYCSSAAADEVEKENISAAYICTWFRPDSHRTVKYSKPDSAQRLNSWVSFSDFPRDSSVLKFNNLFSHVYRIYSYD